MGKARIAIIGAGLTGLIVARALRDVASVTIFEKSRGFGGRMSTRRAEPFAFDHGAQYFTAKSPAFQSFIDPFLASGTVAEWTPRRVEIGAQGAVTPLGSDRPMYVGVPAMNALAKALAQDLDVARSTRVARMSQDAGGWRLEMEAGAPQDGFDWVLCTAPAEQARALMPASFSETSALSKARTSGCFTLMLGFEHALDLPWDAAQVTSGPLGWIALNDTKSGRPSATSLVVQSTNAWAEAHMEKDAGKVEALLHAALADLVDLRGEPAYTSLHRWRYAAVEAAVGRPYLLDTGNRLAAAGDWCLRPRVEAAFDSGTALAEALRAQLS